MPARTVYDLGYRLIRMPWELGPRDELVRLVTSGRLRPGRAVDLGCGTGANAVYLAQHGFEVTGIDFAPTALAKPNARFLLWCFEWATRRRDRLTGLRSVQPGELERRFGPAFTIERISGTTPDLRRMLPGFAAYLMTRHGAKRPGGYGAGS